MQIGDNAKKVRFRIRVQDLKARKVRLISLRTDKELPVLMRMLEAYLKTGFEPVPQSPELERLGKFTDNYKEELMKDYIRRAGGDTHKAVHLLFEDLKKY